MAWQQPHFVVSFHAAINLTTHMFQAVRLTTDAKITKVTSLTTPIVGILQNNPTSGMEGSVMVVGVSKVVAGAACARGLAKVNGAVTTYGGHIVTGTTNQDQNYKVNVVTPALQAGDRMTAIVNFGG